MMAELLICSVCGRMRFTNTKEAANWRMMFFCNDLHFICPKHYVEGESDAEHRARHRLVLALITRNYLSWYQKR
jgi:hypothetical protein